MFTTVIILFVLANVVYLIMFNQWNEKSILISFSFFLGVVSITISDYLLENLFRKPDEWIAQYKHYDKGIAGKVRVISKLRSILSDQYTIIPPVVVGDYGDTDIVVVGPKGIIAIEVKNWLDPILIKEGIIWRQKKNGNVQERVSSNPFNQIKDQVDSIKVLLKQNRLPHNHVTPLVVFAGKNVAWKGKNPTLLCHVDKLKKALDYIGLADSDFFSKRKEITELLQGKYSECKDEKK